MTLTMGSLFSGVGGFDLGFERIGIRTVWQVEIESFCRRILARHFPRATRYADILDCCGRSGTFSHDGEFCERKHHLRKVDIVCAGVPCQDVSVAGKREGLGGKRTGLFFEFARILRELRPTWFVFENVPGLFSSNEGRDFAEVLRVLMVECGYGVSWRVLNSQFFGVAQRRRRVFIVGYFGKPCPAEILFEPESSSGNLAEGGEAGKRIAASITSGTGRVGSRGADDGANIVQQAISAKWAKGSSGPAGDEHHNLVAAPITTGMAKGGAKSDFPDGIVVASTLRESDGHHGRSSPRGDGCDKIVAATLSSANLDKSHAAGRRREDDFNLAYCLREDPGGIGQGHNTTFAIGTDPEHKERSSEQFGATREVDGAMQRNADDCPEADADRMRDFAGLPEGLDSARYRALGNAVTVQVAQFVAQGIAAHEGRQ